MTVKKSCPINGEICVDGVRKDFKSDPDSGQKYPCHLWAVLQFQNSQTGKQWNEGACSWAWAPRTQLDAANIARQTTASVDKMVNTFVKVLPTEMQKKALSNPGPVKLGLENGQ